MKLYNGDCLEVLDLLIKEGVKVDAIITDPPYKIASRGGYTSAGGMLKSKKVREGSIFNHNSTDIKEYLPKFYQILKEQSHCYVMVNNKNLTNFLKVIDDSQFHLVKTMVWAKDNKIMSQAYMSQIEFILFLRKGKFKKINNCGTSDLMVHANKKTKGKDGKPIHLTEKPTSLMQVLIENSSIEGDVILDPFMGSGTTGVACKNLNRDFIGIELDKKYYDISVDRIRDTTPYLDDYVGAK